MGDIARGILGGGWALIVGWIFPTALNLVVLYLVLAPNHADLPLVQALWPTSKADGVALLLACAVLFGLILNALQVTLYRILEGYALWPNRLYNRRAARHRARRQFLTDRLDVLRLQRRDPDVLNADERQRLTQLLADHSLQRVLRADQSRTTAQRALLHERLGRYPIDDTQIAPTRLGNAIRRFEEYGYDRYRLDTQVLWDELLSSVPDQTRRQVDTARASVDFFVALMYGHVVVAACSLASLPQATNLAVPAATIGTLSGLIVFWYRSAVASTDEWAAAVRALVNKGRKPLADSLGLSLPQSLAQERSMWTLVSRLSRRPYDPRAVDAFAPYRAEPDSCACCTASRQP